MICLLVILKIPNHIIIIFKIHYSQKQCRDENGFKCHTMSEGHQRQMLLCADNPGHLVKVTSEFSSDFLGGFLQILRRSYGGKRVSANKVRVRMI